jgi:hypothetical protein
VPDCQLLPPPHPRSLFVRHQASHPAHVPLFLVFQSRSPTPTCGWRTPTRQRPRPLSTLRMRLACPTSRRRPATSSSSGALRRVKLAVRRIHHCCPLLQPPLTPPPPRPAPPQHDEALQLSQAWMPLSPRRQVLPLLQHGPAEPLCPLPARQPGRRAQALFGA